MLYIAKFRDRHLKDYQVQAYSAENNSNKNLKVTKAFNMVPILKICNKIINK